MAAVAMPMAMRTKCGATEATIGRRPAIRPSVQAGYRRKAGTAVPSWREAHRCRADGRATHQRQDDAARSFDGASRVFQAYTRSFRGRIAELRHARRGEASKTKSTHGNVQRPMPSAAAGKMR